MKNYRNLVHQFVAFNTDKRLSTTKKKTLLAVSGGKDSTAMCELFKQANFPFAIAHCNFKLRDEESDKDEQFVTQLASKYGVPFFVKQFDTKHYAMQNNCSIQVAARELRYAWFEEIRSLNSYNLIATAHHLNDTIETILFNLIKGTGIRGLRGIPVRLGNVVRPMHFAAKLAIDTFVMEHNLQYREDSSNASVAYTRNKIRHQIIPLLKEINPSLEDTFAQKIDLFTELEVLYEKELKKTNKQFFLPRGKDIYIPIIKVKKTLNASTILYEYLKNYGFNTQQVNEIVSCVDQESSKQFISAKARIIKDRTFFILTNLQDTANAVHYIHSTNETLTVGGNKLVFKAMATGDVKISTDKNSACIDIAKIELPLLIRKWKEGDYFYPFGMNLKKKKLKKYFNDQKVPLHEKENTWLIESNKKIVWVAGHRIDERFKVTEKTIQVLTIKLQVYKNAEP